MKRLPVFEQFIYEFDAPTEVLSTALEIALRVPYRFPSGFIGTRTSEVYRKFMNISVQQSD